MKVLLVNKFFYRRGGAEVVFFNTADLLRRAGHQVVEFSTHHPENQPSPFQEYFVESVDFPTLRGAMRLTRQAVRAVYNREAYRKILALARRERPDIAHLHNYYYHLSPSILYALRRAGVPVVHTLHDYHLDCPNHIFYDYRHRRICRDCPKYGFQRVIINGCMNVGRLRSVVGFLEAVIYHALGTYRRLVDRYIAPSQFLRSRLLQRPVPRNKCTVLPNPVEDWENMGPPPAHGPFLYAGRLAREKGLDLILEVAQRMPQTRWRLAGSGPFEGELRAMIRREGVANIELLGQIAPEQLREEYRRAMAVVLPSRCYENCPLTVLEAMSAGRPVIGARIGGITELVRDGQTGWLFEPGSADALEGAVRGVADDSNAARCAGQAAKFLFGKHYSSENYLEGLLRVYVLVTGFT